MRGRGRSLSDGVRSESMHMHGANGSKYDFIELRIQAEFLDICGDNEGAQRLRDVSLEIAREVDLTCYAYQLMWRGRIDDAILLLEHNAAANPLSWNVFHSLGEAYECRGDLVRSLHAYRRAADLVEDGDQRGLVEYAMVRLDELERAVS